MNSFLRDVAQDVILKYADKLSDIAFVFPNKRTTIYFKKELAAVSKRNIWIPDIFTISAFIRRMTGLVEADSLTLNFELYEVFKKFTTNFDDNDDSFENFYHTGEIILNDFNDVDNYLADTARLFANVKDLLEIDIIFDKYSDEEKEIIKNFWASFSSESMSRQKSRFLKLWQQLPLIYTEYKKHLRSKNIAYPGLVYRHIADLISENRLPILKYKTYIFIGFNALNKCEAKLFDHFKTIGCARFYWDFDQYYLSPSSEAGLYMRNNINRFPPEIYKTPPSFFVDKELKLISAPLVVGQAKLLPQLLASIPEHEYNQTAIILGDENMLFPVLHSMPDSVSRINVTMGLPLQETSLFSFIEQYFNFHYKADKAENKRQNQHYLVVVRLLRHPLVFYSDKTLIESIIARIESENILYVPESILIESNSELLNLIFRKMADGQLLLENLLNILYLLFTKNAANDDNLPEREYIYQTYTKLKRLLDIIQQKPKSEFSGIDFVIRLARHYIASIKIPFEGEAFEGIQVMGLMETRNIDFKHVIFLGVNEGSVPSISSPESFITANLRYVFGLPIIKQQDSIFAYLFFRVLQRAESIVLVHNNITSFDVNGELSRFVRQLEFETSCRIEKLNFVPQICFSPNQPIVVRKDATVLYVLQKYCTDNGERTSYLSASAINHYIDCSLLFYFKHVASIPEPEQLLEEITPPVFGNLLHNAMEQIYLTLIKAKKTKRIEKADIIEVRKNIESVIDSVFRSHFKITTTEIDYAGVDMIVREVLRKQISNILNVDERNTPFEIVNLEEEYNRVGHLQINVGGEFRYINLKGIIDRVDCVESRTRIIDYKTGVGDREFKTMDDLFVQTTTDRKKAILQTFYYADLFLSKYPDAKSIMPGIYTVREMYDSDFDPAIWYKEDKEKYPVADTLFVRLLSEFRERLVLMLQELFDPNIDFRQTEKETLCTTCPYALICGRL